MIFDQIDNDTRWSDLIRCQMKKKLIQCMIWKNFMIRRSLSQKWHETDISKSNDVEHQSINSMNVCHSIGRNRYYHGDDIRSLKNMEQQVNVGNRKNIIMDTISFYYCSHYLSMIIINNKVFFLITWLQIHNIKLDKP